MTVPQLPEAEDLYPENFEETILSTVDIELLVTFSSVTAKEKNLIPIVCKKRKSENARKPEAENGDSRDTIIFQNKQISKSFMWSKA